MANRTIRTYDAESSLLRKLETGYSIAAACKAGKIHRSRYYEWRQEDPEFAAKADDAIESGTDVLEDSATRQAIHGNSSLMTLLLKARRREKYGDKWEGALTGKDGGPLLVFFGEDTKGPG